MRAYRIIAKIKNNRLWRSIEEQHPEVKSQKAAAKKLKVNLSLLGDYLNMKKWPHNVSRGWSPSALKIAKHLGQSVEWLFDPELYGQPPLMREVTMEVDRPQLPEHFMMMLPEARPDEQLDINERRRKLYEAINLLRPKEVEILKLRFGLEDGRDWTLEEVAVKFGVHRERIRQIEARALRKLRHPSLHARDAL